MLIKKRLAKKSERGLYIQDKELLETNFLPDTNFKYVLDVKNKKIVILPTENHSKNLVSKRTLKNGNFKPVIDIRQKDVKHLLSTSEFFQITISTDKITVEAFESKQKNIIEKAISKVKKCFSNKVTDITDILSVNKKFEISMQGDFKRAVGFEGAGYSEQLSFLDNVFDKKTCQTIKKSIEKVPLIVNSYCSGAGMMDLAFKNTGFDIAWAIEIDSEACKTYRHNIGNHIVNADMVTYDKNLIPHSSIKIGGTPCFGLSNNNRVTNYLDNPNNILIYKFIEAIKNDKDTQIFVLENVPQILSAGNGKFKNEILQKLSDFEISYDVLNAADFGDPQLRERAIFIGSKIGKIDLPKPTFSKENYRTVGDAFKGLTSSTPNQKDITIPKPSTIQKMSFVPQGGNIKNIPEDIRPKGQHSDVYRRLELGKPSITIVNPRKSNIIHPLLNRILSVRECARIQSMPDTFVYQGNLSGKQMQVANGTPYLMMKAIAEKIKNAIDQFNSCNNVVLLD